MVYSTEPRDEARFMKTPLLVAISLQNLQMVRLLIQSGADCNTGVGPLGLPIHKVWTKRESYLIDTGVGPLGLPIHKVWTKERLSYLINTGVGSLGVPIHKVWVWSGSTHSQGLNERM